MPQWFLVQSIKALIVFLKSGVFRSNSPVKAKITDTGGSLHSLYFFSASLHILNSSCSFDSILGFSKDTISMPKLAPFSLVTKSGIWNSQYWINYIFQLLALNVLFQNLL